MFAIRRPQRVDRMLDVNQLLDRQLGGFRSVLRCGRRHKDQRRREHDSHCFVPFPHNAPTIRKSKIKFQTQDRRGRLMIESTRPTEKSWAPRGARRLKTKRKTKNVTEQEKSV